MGELKATSFRINEEDLVKFKEFAEKEGCNQAEAFKSIMQTVEMAKAKNLIKDRAKEIEVFQNTINTLMNMFLNSLSVNQTSEERIREELSKEIQLKDNTIANNLEKLQELKKFNENYKNNEKLLNDKILEMENNLKRLENEIKEKTKNIEKINSNNDLLQEQLQEYKFYKEDYKNLSRLLEKAKNNISELKNENNILRNENEQFSNKILSANEMLEFYKKEIENKNNSILELKNELKESQMKFDIKIEELKKQQEASMKVQLENIKMKHQYEIDMKELNIKQLSDACIEKDNKINELNVSLKSNKITKKVIKDDKKN